MGTMTSTLQILNIALLTAGGLCGLGVLVWLARDGRWRDPLRRVTIPAGGPTIAGVGAAILVYIGLLPIAVSLVERVPSSEAAPAPGSAAWHRATLAEQAVGVLVALLMAVLLAQARRRQPSGFRAGPLAGLVGGVLGLLVLFPLAALQDDMGRILWRWIHPEAAPPLHAVLQALGHCEWGVWGTVQLVVGAVLIAPLTEELFFRGVLLQALCFHFRQAWLAVGVSAVVFGCVHAQPQAVLPLLTMGVVLGYLRLRCGALWPCILLHALFNARTMVFVILAPELLQEG